MFSKLVNFDEVLQRIDENFSCSSREPVETGILQSIGSVLWEDVYCPEDIPGFDRSRVDGYAVRWQDTAGADPARPVKLALGQEIEAGKPPQSALESGNACYIPTGGMLPENADSVIMLEDTQEVPGGVLVKRPLKPGENVFAKGADIKKGTRMLPAGHVLRPQDIGALASIGKMKVATKGKLRVAIISTGNEISEPSVPLPLGMVRDINTYTLYSLIMRDGMEPVNYGIVRDDFNILKNIFEKAVQNADVVLIVGGSSVGKLDLTVKILESMEGARILAHGISIKPGKPTVLAKVGNKAVIGLPGHPAGAFMVYQTIGRYLLGKIWGSTLDQKGVKAVFQGRYKAGEDRDDLVLVRITGNEQKAFASVIQYNSSMMNGIVKADGYTRVSVGKEIADGDKIFANLF